jgi:hypothetical protein
MLSVIKSSLPNVSIMCTFMSVIPSTRKRSWIEKKTILIIIFSVDYVNK